jgi:hypothetical protein
MQKYWGSSSDGQRGIVSAEFVGTQVGLEEHTERLRWLSAPVIMWTVTDKIMP